MIFPTRQLPDSLSHKDRSYSFVCVRAELFGGVLAVRQGKNRDAYAVEENPALTPTYREFVALNVGSGELYLIVVPLSAGEVGRCTCTGFARWQNCKHETSLRDLVQERSLPPL